MNNFSYKIYTDSSLISSHSDLYSKGRSAASVIKDAKGKVISEGKQTERLSIITGDLTYSLAIQTLSPKEQEQIQKQGHAGWWKKFFWKPLRLQTAEGEVMILVNIQSAVKRLSHLGLSEKEIKKGLEEGSLIEHVQKGYIEKELKNGNTKLDAFSKIFLDVKDCQTAEGIYSYSRILGHSIQFSHLLVKQLREQGLNALEISNLCDFVKENQKKWETEAKKTKQPIYIRERDFPGKIPRNIQYNPDGTIYILFNRVKSQGDRLLGKGAYKTAKRALNLINGEMCARLAMETNNPDHKKMALEELNLAGRMGNQEGVMETYSSTVVSYDSKKKGQKIGYMQKLYNGGDLKETLKNVSRLTKKEKFLIAKRILQGMSRLHEQKILHRDLKDANVFLKRHPDTQEIVDCVVADLGFACEEKDKEKKQTLNGTPLYMSPEYFLTFLKANVQNRLVAQATKETVNAPPNDNWAVGMVLYQLFKDDIPEWKSTNPVFWLSDLIQTFDDLAAALRQYQTNPSFPEPKDPHSIGHVIINLLHPDPAKRMTAAQGLAKVEDLIKQKGLAIS